MGKGRVKWYNDTKGYGFIETDEGKEVFVHRTGLANPYDGLQDGQEVVFEVKQGDKGEVAFNVK